MCVIFSIIWQISQSIGKLLYNYLLLTGETIDIGILLLFTFYEVVYYSKTTTSFPSKSTEELGNFVGFGEHVGDAMTFIILTRDTNKLINRSNVQSAEKHPNLQISPDGEVDASNNIDKCFIQSKYDNLHDDTETTTILPGFDPANLIGREYIDLPVEDGDQHKVCILKVIADHIDDLAKQPAQTKFLVSSRTGNYVKTSSYNEIIDHLNG
jgi:hypothetical protein